MLGLLRLLRFLSPLRPARKMVTRRVREGDRRLIPLAVALWVPVVLGKAGRKREKVVLVEKLEPGEGLLLRTIAQGTKAQRALAKAITDQPTS